MEDARHHFLPDPVLSEHGAGVEARLSEYAARMTVEDLQALMDPVTRELFQRTMNDVGAESGAIWLVDEARTKLQAGYSSRDPDLLGKEQSLDEGLISLVVASEQAICENQVYRNAGHSKRIDEALGVITCAMIAVPFYLGGGLRGVVSCVQWKQKESDPDPPGLSAAHLGGVQRLSVALERLINFQFLRIIFDLQS